MSLFKLKTGIRRFIIEKLHLNRPASYPYITGDGFRAIAQHVFDEISDFDPKNVEENDIIFVRNDFIEDFFINKHIQIKNKYILVSSNDDTNISREFEKYVDEKIIHWFTSALLFKNEKVGPIPLGLTNYHYNYLGRGKISALCKNKGDSKFKKNKMCYGFAVAPTAKERVALKQLLLKNNFADSIETRWQADYYKKMSGYKFIICPDGRAIDAHRTWEALYLGVIPIVKTSVLVRYFKDMGMPLLVIEDWNELEKYSDDFLEKKYTELESSFENPVIYMNYWINLVSNKRIKYYTK